MLGAVITGSRLPAMRPALCQHAVITLITLLLAACGNGSQDAPQLTVVKVDRGDVAAAVTAGGTLQALVTVQVGTQVSGRIASLGADFNSVVKKGQVLARIDPQTFETSVAAARANVTAAQGSVAKAKATTSDAERAYKRALELRPQGLIAQADVDTASVNVEKAKADDIAGQGLLAQAAAQLRRAEVDLSYTVIRAPTDGVVITRSVDVGQTVAASLQAPTLFTVAQDLAKMQVHTNVSESDVGHLKQDLPVEFSVDAYPNQRFLGRISQVRVSPQTVQNVVTYDAVVDVNNADLKLKPGMTANVTFRYAEAKNVLRVANASLRFKPSPEYLKILFAKRKGATEQEINDGQGRGSRELPLGVKRLWKQDGNRIKPVKVTLGVTDGSVTEVLDGDLAEGDALVTAMKGGDSAKSGLGGPGGPSRLF